MKNNILNEIVENKKKWLLKNKVSFPQEIFQNKLYKSKRSLLKVLSKNTKHFILECKKSSPSQKLIRKDFDIKSIVSEYDKYASAISVLTDEKYFDGNFNFLTTASMATDKPILCKDFIISEYQIFLARYYNADAILLMLSILSDDEYKTLSHVANTLDLDILTEVHNTDELNRAIKLEAKIIGINNRNLEDLSIDLNNTLKLAPQIPKDRIVISESGLTTNSDIKKLSPYVRGFLIGSSLMSKKNLNSAIKKLIWGENKVCGITSLHDMTICNNAGALYGGLIFAEQSIRKVSLQHAYTIKNNTNMKVVGVFQNQPIEYVKYVIKSIGIKHIQLHGHETEAYIASLKSYNPELVIWKAYGLTNNFPRLMRSIDTHVLDNRLGEKLGGTGKPFQWKLIPKKADLSKIIISGGLSIDNIRQALALGAKGLDFNSKLEKMPGVKDISKVSEVFHVIKQGLD